MNHNSGLFMIFVCLGNATAFIYYLACGIKEKKT